MTPVLKADRLSEVSHRLNASGSAAPQESITPGAAGVSGVFLSGRLL